MAEYIEKEEAMHIAFKSPFFSDALMEEMKAIPAADVAPVRHGMWETIDASTWRWSHDGAKPVHRVKYRHNECGRVVQRKEPYCPHCGAKMLEG